jgi:hypothetical protein
MRGEFADFDFQATDIIDGGNSGMFFRRASARLALRDMRRRSTAPAKIPRRPTGCYNFQNVYGQLVPPNTFTQEVIAQGNHTVIRVNGKVTVEYIDDKNT